MTRFPPAANWAPLPSWDPTIGKQMFPAWQALVKLAYTSPAPVSHRALVAAAVAASGIQEQTASGLVRRGVDYGYLHLVLAGRFPENRRYALSERFRRHLASSSAFGTDEPDLTGEPPAE